MAKYLLLKHYRGGPASVNDVPMDQWTPEELSAHVQYMEDFAARLEGTGEFVDGQALYRRARSSATTARGGRRSPMARSRGPRRERRLDGDRRRDLERALELAGGAVRGSRAGGKPIHEWLELRPFLAAPPTITE